VAKAAFRGIALVEHLSWSSRFVLTFQVRGIYEGGYFLFPETPLRLPRNSLSRNPTHIPVVPYGTLHSSRSLRRQQDGAWCRRKRAGKRPYSGSTSSTPLHRWTASDKLNPAVGQTAVADDRKTFACRQRVMSVWSPVKCTSVTKGGSGLLCEARPYSTLLFFTVGAL
jgi:hypothetical protein